MKPTGKTHRELWHPHNSKAQHEGTWPKFPLGAQSLFIFMPFIPDVAKLKQSQREPDICQDYSPPRALLMTFNHTALLHLWDPSRMAVLNPRGMISS